MVTLCWKICVILLLLIENEVKVYSCKQRMFNAETIFVWKRIAK
jgi:hypothetical protein